MTIFYITYDCRWLRNNFSIPRAPENMSHKKTSLQFISTFGRNGTLSLEYLGPVAVFQQNINLREAAQTSSPNIAHSAWMHESDAQHTLKFDIYEFNRVRNRWHYVSVMMCIFYIDWQHYWKCDWILNIGANAHGKQTVSTKQPQHKWQTWQASSDIRDLYWASFSH